MSRKTKSKKREPATELLDLESMEDDVSEITPSLEDPSTEEAAAEAQLSRFAWLGRFDWQTVGVVLGVKAVVLICGGITYQILANERVFSFYRLLEIWNRWDGLRHIRIADSGYTNTGEFRADLVGFPLYPWLVRAFSYVFQDTLVSSYIVSALASVAAGILIYRLTRVDEPETVARNSLWFLLIFPTSYYLHVNYNESLFLAVTLGCFLAARQKRWVLAGILGIFVCMSRLNGLVIIPALMVEAFQQYRADRRLNWQWAFIAIMPLGLGVHMLANYSVAGDPLAFITVGREMFYKSFAPPWRGIIDVFNSMWRTPSSAMIVGVQEFFFIVLGFICIVFSAFLLRPAYTVWIGLNWLMVTCVGFILSVPRYTLSFFPIFILFAKLGKRPVWYSMISVWSLLLMAFFISEYVRGHWTY